MKFVGKRDAQTAGAGGARAKDPAIAGVRIFELGNVLTRSGFMTEIVRNGSGAPAGCLNVIDRLYAYGAPDNWRLSPGSAAIPDIL